MRDRTAAISRQLGAPRRMLFPGNVSLTPARTLPGERLPPPGPRLYRVPGTPDGTLAGEFPLFPQDLEFSTVPRADYFLCGSHCVGTAER
jgi:hypothetical protein